MHLNNTNIVSFKSAALSVLHLKKLSDLSVSRTIRIWWLLFKISLLRPTTSQVRTFTAILQTWY